MPTLPTAVLTSLAALALGACAAEPPPPPMQVLVKLAQPAADGAAIAAQASAATGRAVRYVASSSEFWHALAVPCTGASDCEAALQQLRADTAHYAAVQRDERKRIVTP
jgi:hypothetical protein